MKLQFKHQKFQEDASISVCDCFAGQIAAKGEYLIDKGEVEQTGFMDTIGFSNNAIKITPEQILRNLNKVQRDNNIQPSDTLEGNGINLTIEMETGVGKTYTYIKTMYELNAKYGWSKFIIVVPSIAIREGVDYALKNMQEHFAEDYGKKIRSFVYSSSNLTELENFASSSEMQVMIINSQAFNATGKDARRIYMKLDSFRSRRPIDVIAKTTPILIIDEPQSVEGAKTKEKLKEFNPLFTLRYSATHKEKYNMVYRLDAIDALQHKLVKKISTTGFEVKGESATNAYIYFDKVNISKSAPTATLEFEVKTKTGVTKRARKLDEGDNLYELSGELQEYQNGYTITSIDARFGGKIEFANGLKLNVGDIVGRLDENQLARLQIRETIRAHIKKERVLYHRGIKVLSLFFIDSVAKYKNMTTIKMQPTENMQMFFSKSMIAY